MKSKAAIFEGIGKPLVIDEIEVDDPKAGEVLIKLDATGLCHTEIWYMGGGDTQTRSPIVLGHEGCGIVEKCGPGVKSLKEGDRVVPLYIPQCGHCRECAHPDTNLCSTLDDAYFGNSMNDGTMRFHRGGHDLHHFMLCSTFSHYTVCHEESVAKIRPDAPPEAACLFGCAVTTGIGAAPKPPFDCACSRSIWAVHMSGVPMAPKPESLMKAIISFTFDPGIDICGNAATSWK